MNEVLEEREFQFTRKDFDRICRLIRDHAGISLSDGKFELVYSRLSRRLRATGLFSFDAYLKRLEENDEDEWEAFTNSLTTNLTAFFREPHHFHGLAEQLSAIGRRSHPIVLWCSACSTGEEAYSMAITAVETFDTWTPPVTIIATDIDTQVLKKAEAGIYPIDHALKLERDRMKRFFLKGEGDSAGYVKIRAELKRLISFRRLNLLDPTWAIRPGLDAIFCRNVMIYFEKETQLKLLAKMAPLLRKDGLLYVGHSENFYHLQNEFALRGRTVYQLAHALKQAHTVQDESRPLQT